MADRRANLTDKLRWLLTETVVVVVGILIALGVDDYRSYRADRELEIDYLNRIEADLESDLDIIERVWNRGIRAKREALEEIAPIVRAKRPVPDDKTAFLKAVARGGIGAATPEQWHNDTTFQDLVVTGNLRLIRNPAIRAAIDEYYEGAAYQNARLSSRFSDYFRFVHAVLPAELRDDIDADVLDEWGVEFAMEHLKSDEFRRLLNQEFNVLLFMESIEYEPATKALMERLQAYRNSLEH